MAWTYRLVEPHDVSPEMLDRVAAIYEESFPPSERDPFPNIVRGVETGSTSLFLAEAKGLVGGFAVTIPLGIEGVSCLGYLAVDGKLRGQGIGGGLLRYLLRSLHERSGDTELLWEVERPDPGAGPDDPAWRRIAFYQAHGGIVLDRVTEYQMPDLSGPGTVPALLMWTSIVDRPPLTHHELEQYVMALLCSGYGLERDHPLVQEVVDSIHT